MLKVKCFSYLAAVVLAVHVLTLPRVSSTRNFDRSFLRKIFKCPTCQLDACPLPEGFPACEVVLEPGVCACCPVCAQQLGDSCGLTTGRCGKGLTCRPLPNDPDPIGAILSGNAICM